MEKDRFFKQLDKKLKSDGVIELLRKGLRYKHLRLDLFYVRPSVHNPEAAALYEKNTMYVDKGLADIKAVQTLSRLNRSHPDKKDTFILDFVNEPGVIKEAFDRYYKTTILSGETDVKMFKHIL